MIYSNYHRSAHEHAYAQDTMSDDEDIILDDQEDFEPDNQLAATDDDSADEVIADETATIDGVNVPALADVPADMPMRMRADVHAKIVQTTNGQPIVECETVELSDRITPNLMSRFEHTECVNIRAAQIAAYNNCLVDVNDLDDPIEMAKRELAMRRSPLVLRRVVGSELQQRANGLVRVEYCEFWDVNEMTYIHG